MVGVWMGVLNGEKGPRDIMWKQLILRPYMDVL